LIPPYPNRLGFLPLSLEDFEDGGAYPEIHVAQYPLNMGKPNHKSSALVPVQLNENGAIRTDIIVKQGSNKNKLVQSQMSDIKEKKLLLDEMAPPTEEEEQATAERTRQALEALLDTKIKSAKPTSGVTGNAVADPQYIRYTPNADAPGYKEETSQRIIKMVEAQVDPMEPPKHKHSKVPHRPPSPPVPVLHSPPRKLTVADQQAWKVPPCISNWKNARGFIIPLDKRLAADGRGLQEVTINNKFATLTESLYIAERKAVQDLNLRNELRKKVALREKEDREQKLREMANRARLERTGGGGAGGGGGGHFTAEDTERRARDEESEEEEQEQRRRRSDSEQSESSESSEESSVEGFERETEEDKIARQQRERIRLDRRKEREREMRLANMKGNLRKSKIDRDENRDVSEKIALGMLKGTSKLAGDSLFDSRMFNQTTGMDAGFGAEDEYNTYSKPLFDRGEGESIYRPKKNDSDIYGGDADAELAKLTNTSKFRPDKGFKGAESNDQRGPRGEPVQFEKATEHDPFERNKERERKRSPERGGGGRGERERGRDSSRDRNRGGERGGERETDHRRDSSPPRNKKARYHSDDEN
jgi:SNW domain-containing protein 1